MAIWEFQCSLYSIKSDESRYKKLFWSARSHLESTNVRSLSIQSWLKRRLFLTTANTTANTSGMDYIIFAIYAVLSDTLIPTTLARYLSFEVCKYSADCIDLPFSPACKLKAIKVQQKRKPHLVVPRLCAIFF